MNMTIAELLAFDVAPADASLHIELSKDELTHYSTLSSTRGPHTIETSASSCRCSRYQFLAELANLIQLPIKVLISVATSSCSTQGRPMEASDPTRGEAGVGVSNTEEGRSTAHSCVLKGLVQSMGPSRCEDMAGTTRSFCWIGGDQMARALTTHEDPEEYKQYGALAQRYPHFGSLDGAVTAATPLEIGSLICFGLKCGMHSLSCDQTVYGEEALSIGIGTRQSDTKPLQPRHARLVGSTLKYRRAQFQQKGSLRTKQRASHQSKEGLFEAWSHAQHQPKRRAPQAIFDWPPRARKRSERVFEDF
ncbi:BQ5605_C006g04167 [Microbotryum silenes-dioicae]|uniref:BQ5605_C006g04167 protein n=1 Tax=Microbotryum silenes-dioicae TaxID=796604 RepID=A0A2X0P203_9BASI|nr:BQ5605_C006g04167 [Microbotryum silenes-dioicae]